MATKPLACSKCGSDRFYTVGTIQGRRQLIVKCMKKACGHEELPAPLRVAMGRVWA